MSLRKTAEAIFGSKHNSVVLVEAEPLRYNYDNVNGAHRNKLQQHTYQIRSLYQQTLENIILQGKLLLEVREILKHGEFGKWLELEFEGRPSWDTANNFMNTARLAAEYGDTTIIKSGLPAKSLYIIARSTVPTEAREEALSRGAEVNEHIAREIILKYRRLNLDTRNITTSTKELLIDSPISENAKELERLASLSASRQLAVARILADNHNLTVRSACKQLKEPPSLVSSGVLGSNAHVAPKVTEVKGDWLSELKLLASNSVDVLVVDAPLEQAWLLNYSDLCNTAQRVLHPSGILLVTCGQKNLIHLGRHIGKLEIGWTYVIQGRSTWLPLVCLYKAPWRRGLHNAQMSEAKETGLDTRAAVEYYINKFLPQAGSLTYVTCSASSNQGLGKFDAPNASRIHRIYP